MKRPCKVCEMLLLLLIIQLHESGCLWRGRSHFALILLIENLHCYHSNRKHSALAAYSWWNLLVSAQPQLIFFFRLSAQKCGCICLQILRMGPSGERRTGRQRVRQKGFMGIISQNMTVNTFDKCCCLCLRKPVFMPKGANAAVCVVCVD